MGKRAPEDAAIAVIDHLVLGAADLEQGVRFIEQRTGVRPLAGGRHEALGTHNALLSLGERQYLEVLAPDPSQDRLVHALAELSSLSEPKLIKWAVAALMETAVQTYREVGVPIGAVERGSRRRNDGRVLQWRQMGFLTLTRRDVPFVIEWDVTSVHPADDSPSGCALRSLVVETPEPDTVAGIVRQLGLDVEYRMGSQATLRAVLDTPRGAVELRSAEG